MRPLLSLLALLLVGCGPTPSASPPADAPKPTPAVVAEPSTPKADKGVVKVDKPVWKDGQGNPVEAATPRKTKRWNGLVTGNWKDPLPHVAPDERCVVLHALAGSPAALAGLKEMDVIVLSEGIPVKDYKDYIAGARQVEVGDTLDIEIVRDGQRQAVSFPMLEMPGDMLKWRRDHFPGTPGPAYDVALLRPDLGERLTSASAAGSYQVLYFWATWCGPCRRTSPVVSELHDDFGGNGLQVVGISSETEPVIREFLGKNATYTYPVGWDDDGSVKRDYEVKKLPTIVLVDKDGTVLDWDISVSGVNRVTNKVRKLLAPPG